MESVTRVSVQRDVVTFAVTWSSLWQPMDRRKNTYVVGTVVCHAAATLVASNPMSGRADSGQRFNVYHRTVGDNRYSVARTSGSAHLCTWLHHSWRTHRWRGGAIGSRATARVSVWQRRMWSVSQLLAVLCLTIPIQKLRGKYIHSRHCVISYNPCLKFTDNVDHMYIMINTYTMTHMYIMMNTYTVDHMYTMMNTYIVTHMYIMMNTYTVTHMYLMMSTYTVYHMFPMMSTYTMDRMYLMISTYTVDNMYLMMSTYNVDNMNLLMSTYTGGP